MTIEPVVAVERKPVDYIDWQMTEDEMCPNCLTPWKCNGPHILLKKNGFGSVTPTLYRYRDSEAVIKHMDGYTPGEGWEPLYSQSQADESVAAERERCAKVCESFGADPWAVSKECADAIRKGE